MAKTHSLGIRNYPFKFYDRIADKSKKIEVRYLSGYINQIKIGDIINFTLQQQWTQCKVKDIRKYRTYQELLTTEGLNQVVPGVKTVEEALRIYATFPCYQYVDPNGPPKVAAFEIEVISSGSFQRQKPPYTLLRKSRWGVRPSAPSNSMSRATTPYSASSGKLGNSE